MTLNYWRIRHNAGGLGTVWLGDSQLTIVFRGCRRSRPFETGASRRLLPRPPAPHWSFAMNQDEIEQVRKLLKVWPKLSRRERDGILVLAGVITLPRDPHGSHRTPRGATPEWLPVALNILKDSTGQLSDREISKKLGISNSSLSRNETYRRAKRTYATETRKIVRVGRNVGKSKIQEE